MKLLSKYAMTIATMVLCGMLFMFLHNLSPRFKVVEENYKSNCAVNLSRELSKEELSAILAGNNYVTDKKDADFIADTIISRLSRNMNYPNLYFLQKRAFGKVPALVADSAGVLKDKLEQSYKQLGLDDPNCPIPPIESLISEIDLQDGDATISVQVYEEPEDSQGMLYSLLKRKNRLGQKDVPVRMKEHYVIADTIKERIVYAKTDSRGYAVFKGLNSEHGYSVLPIKRGFEYGSTKGVKADNFDKDQTFRFKQIEHRIQMIGNATLKQIKNDGTITVRTPAEYKAEVIKWFVLILMFWWILAIVMLRCKRSFDPVILAMAMFLTGVCVIIMFAIQNPLTEELRGVEMASGVLIGIGFVLLFQFVDFVRLYQGNAKIAFDPVLIAVRWLFLPFKQKVSRIATCLTSDAKLGKKLGALVLLVCCYPFAIFNIPKISNINKPILRLIDRLPKGFGWLLLAIIVTALLFTPLGHDIGGMTVNLKIFGLTFQPSEIAKYLILFFMAAYFTSTADDIIAYSRPNHTNILSKFKTLSWLLVGLVVIMAIYAILGDLGPALVITVTFILLYSLVKSKVNLENLSEDDRWARIFTCDFAMLIYGVLSFALFTFIGYKIGYSLIFAVLWFVCWVGFGILRNKQFFETAFFFNLIVFLFIFGGQILMGFPSLQDSDTAKRFDQRTRMCINTWGDLDIAHHGNNAEPVSNTQVANGLWGMATGGMTGQGLGDGNPNLIPAFHTDMILSSIAEQIGWIGLVLIILALGILLRRIIVTGYRVGHPFAFYLCTGVAVVIAVQFFIIALGSSGIIPLTGITVPFLSYGRVSMVLNLAALGVVLSLSKNIRQEELTEVQMRVRSRSVGDYNYPISIVTWTYIILAMFTLCVWQYYSLWARSKTLIHPAYVLNSQGVPLVEYNPRIALLTREMWAGNIYDRNGVLLATSDKDKLSDKEFLSKLTGAGMAKHRIDSIAKTHNKRYYPFGEHLFFMLGDQNNGLYFNYDEDNPIGYMAEAQHLSYLRDYDNTYYDKQNNPVKLYLKGKIQVGGRYLPSVTRDTIVRHNLRNNKELAKYLKTGIQGRPLRRHNKDARDGDFDLHLTLDARLQTDIQNRISTYVNKNRELKDNKLLRISVVVLDAQNGELLTSANYPLPDYARLREEDEAARKRDRKGAVYSDNNKINDENWLGAYTDRDLGLTYQTMPGSTAKVMSAIAGLQQMGTSAADKKYLITADDIIEKGKAPEPHGYNVPMKDAIVMSSNCYFIHLVNENDLYRALDSVYESVGIGIGSVTPYYLDYEVDEDKQTLFQEKIRQNESMALAKYANRVEKGEHEEMNKGEWRWAWGQGYEHYELQASPLNMARVASAVVNGGKMPYTQYLLPKNKYEKKHIQSGYNRLMTSSEANILKGYMLAEAANQKPRNSVVLPASVGGKTGTPERAFIEKSKSVYSKKLRRNVTYYYHSKDKKWHGNPSKKNDGWYMFFVEGKDKKHPLAVCVRMERSTGSGAAVRLTKSVVLESLYANGYMTR